MTAANHQTIKLGKGPTTTRSMTSGVRICTHTPRRRPPADAAGTHAVHAIRKHTAESHAAVLALLNELLTMSADRQIGPRSTPGGETPHATLVSGG
jgi:hypothetical protein